MNMYILINNKKSYAPVVGSKTGSIIYTANPFLKSGADSPPYPSYRKKYSKTNTHEIIVF